MLWKMQCFTLQSMDRTNHKFPVYATRNVQTHLKLTSFRVKFQCSLNASWLVVVKYSRLILKVATN